MNEIDNNDEKLSAFYDGEIADNEINDIGIQWTSR